MQKYRKPRVCEGFKPLKTSKDKQEDSIEYIGISPFIEKLIIPVNHLQSIKDYKYEDGILINSTYKVEVDVKCNIYQSSSRRLRFAKMSSSSNKLLLWIMMETDQNKDFVWINKKRFMEEANMSYNTLDKSIAELHQNALISPSTTKEVYWINPHYFFPGNRVKKYENNLIIKQDRTEE